MYEKYYSEEQLNALQQRQAAYTKEESQAIEQEWDQVFEGFRTLYKAGEDPSCDEAQRLAKRSHELIDKFTGGDPEMRKAFFNMYRQEGGANVLQQHGCENMDQALFEYLAKAMAIAKGQ